MSAAADGVQFNIGDVARRAGVSARTIRLYEELGIIPAPARSPGGTRRYTKDYLFYVEGALLLKSIDFSLEEVRVVGRLARGASMTAAEHRLARQAIADKVDTLRRRIRVLRRLREVLGVADGSDDQDGLATLADLVNQRDAAS
jgi:DNA-binding transcriptional MerR regulator